MKTRLPVETGDRKTGQEKIINRQDVSHRQEPAEPTGQIEHGEYGFFDRKPVTQDSREELLQSLGDSPKWVSAKYFYDQRGSRLFEEITRLPEYYLTRTEMALFAAHSTELGDVIGDGTCLVEYGSGSSAKIRRLLETARPNAYVPIDISRDHLEHNAKELHGDYPWLNVYPTCADITREVALPEPVAGLRRVGFFPGSSIGNFEPETAAKFLRNTVTTLGKGGHLILGVDRKKDPAVLEAAYNDSAGVTAEFNLNLLNHLNLLLQADFRPENFIHRACYDEALGCIQMFLEARVEHEVGVAGQRIHFDAGERLHTENSFKYDSEEVAVIAEKGGYRVADMWTDAKQNFGVFVLQARS